MVDNVSLQGFPYVQLFVMAHTNYLFIFVPILDFLFASFKLLIAF